MLIRVRLRRDFPILATSGVACQYFAAYRQPPDGLAFSHDVTYASFLLQGRARHLVGERDYIDEPGCLTVVAPGCPHRIEAVGEPLELFNVYLDLERRPLPALPPELLLPLRQLLPEQNPGVSALTQVRLAAPSHCRDLLQLILAEQAGERPGRDLVRHDLFRSFLVLIARAAAEQGVQLPLLRDPMLRGVLQRIERDFALPIGLRQLAAEIGWSEAHLCRRFKAACGQTVIQALTQRRIRAAEDLLRWGDDAVQAIALAVGFQDLAYFNRCFKRLAGCTPREYRRRMRETVITATSVATV